MCNAQVVGGGCREWVRLADRLALQSAANEMNRLLCMMASAAAGYHIEEVMQVRLKRLTCSLTKHPQRPTSAVWTGPLPKYLQAPGLYCSNWSSQPMIGKRLACTFRTGPEV